LTEQKESLLICNNKVNLVINGNANRVNIPQTVLARPDRVIK
jgi:hypothetical protein